MLARHHYERLKTITVSCPYVVKRTGGRLPAWVPRRSFAASLTGLRNGKLRFSNFFTQFQQFAVGFLKRAVLIGQYAGPRSCEAMQRILDHGGARKYTAQISVFDQCDAAIKTACLA
jgi:hypothetical protein